MTRADVRLRLIVPVLLVIAVAAGALAVTQIESLRDGVLVLVAGLALAAVIGALAVTTERRRLAMREVERYFTLSPEMVILAGFDGYWKRVNPTVGAVLGYTEREALARPFMEFVHPDDRDRTEEEARRVVGGAKALAFENRILCRDGSYKLIEWTVTPVPEERVMYGIGRDVTDQRRSESEQAALQRLLRRHGTGQALAQRLRIILACAQPGATNLGVATALKVSRQTVALWRARFATHRLEGLIDAPRSGAPRSIDDGAVERPAGRAGKPCSTRCWRGRSRRYGRACDRQSLLVPAAS